jgi:hypothetical protein
LINLPQNLQISRRSSRSLAKYDSFSSDKCFLNSIRERTDGKRMVSFAPDTKVKCKSKIKTFSVLDPIGKEGTNSNTPRPLPNE